MSDEALDLLVAEAAERRIGERWLAEVRAACTEVSRRFDPAVYAIAEGAWTDSEIDDLVQDVVVEQLLRQAQLDYIVDVSESLVDAQRLLRLRVRRQLAARRRRTVIDRLLVRIKAILDGEGFERLSGLEPARYQLRGAGFGAVTPGDEELGRAAAAIRFLPTSPASRDRAPTVYRAEVLDRVIELCFEASRRSLAIGDFDRILRLALTSWYPVVLELDEDRGWPAGYDDSEREWEELVQALMSELSNVDRTALRLKLSGESDSVLAESLGVSRPTAARQKIASFERLREAWGSVASGLGPDEAARLAQEFYWALEQEEPE